ncbi:hypothetical protein [Desulforhabdus amnigena]|uniref:Uncharacterized protein n=1 Tax=Desulforhabdus amnigena TaxID=40218 RepID=A0A9W6FRK6_9BACT|nr:hypothetical protein [Desulforhabdus amnigena]NLJ28976.1 hypothetical protein [Deltaproteobacteria bacterium]GLI33632.1 hypothetical protein DAMNIGENAA_10650 [Desulforhabdus amnigena]
MFNKENKKLISRLVNLLERCFFSDGSPRKIKEGCPEVQDLRNQNDELNERIENLHTKYMQANLQPDRELSFKTEIGLLKEKLREARLKLALTEKKLKVLMPYQEMVQSLKLKNGSLVSKIEHQARLIRSLIENDSKQQKFLSTIEKLVEENRKLKTELRQKSQLLGQLQKYLPPTSLDVVQKLVEKNARLHAFIEEKDAQLEGMITPADCENDLMESFERLSEENIRLHKMKEAKQCLGDFIEKKGKGDPNQVIEALKMENQLLELTHNTREEEIEYFAAEPSLRPLIRAQIKKRNEYKQIFMENRIQDQFSRYQQDEKKCLQAQAREKTALIRENHDLKAELDTRERRWTDLLRRAESQCKALNNEKNQIWSKYQDALAVNHDLHWKLTEMRNEYDSLKRAVEKVFIPTLK